jgi:hypothetical protein
LFAHLAQGKDEIAISDLIRAFNHSDVEIDCQSPPGLQPDFAMSIIKLEQQLAGSPP